MNITLKMSFNLKLTQIRGIEAHQEHDQQFY